MQKIYSILFCLALSIGNQVSAVAQQTNLDSLNKKFIVYREASVQEKVYVHFDRSLYVTGETMWFKIYYTDGVLHRPLEFSKVCYLELIDSDNQPVLQTKVAISKNGGHGSLFIPATINSGNYTLRAYTNWMKNSSPEFYFHSAISIVNPFREPELVKSNSIKPPDAQFFPEGGNLVAGLRSKVAFRVAGENGSGISFKGALLNQNNDTLTRFEPLKFGMGYFYITPEAGKTYKASIVDSKGRKYTYNLPAVQDKGYSIEVSNGEPFTVNINSVDSELPYVYVFIHSRQMVVRAEVVFLKNGAASLSITNTSLPDGISHITVFDGQLNPVGERLHFKRPEKKLTLEVKADQQDYDLRRKGNIELEAKNSTGASSNLSVAIYKLDSIHGPENESIESYFWLSSDLKGSIESPDYYLNTTDSVSAIAADNLMLTHGWSRFTWKDVIQRKQNNPFIAEVRNHIITSQILDEVDKPVANVQTYLSSPGKLIRLHGARSRSDGRTLYEMHDFIGPHKIVIQPNMLRDSIYSIKVISPFSSEFAAKKSQSLQLFSSGEEDLLVKTIGMQVQDVYADERANRITNAVKDSTAFYGKADESYLLDDYTRFQVMEEVMREYVPGVLVRKRKNGFHFILIDKPKKTTMRDDPMILLDGVPIFDADEIMSFDPLKVKKLDVLTRQYYLGNMVFQGVVSYSTYTGDMAGFQLNPKMLTVDYEGLQLEREYYTPVYEDKKSRSSRSPDQRSLIYWAPDVQVENGKKQTLSFYTSDIKGKYIVVVKGISEDGSPASTVTGFQTYRFDN